jgi:multiple sugar transport system permease protein/putative aldouronate transport system permease protein
MRRIRTSSRDRTFELVNNALLAVALITVGYPLIYIVSASFSSTQAVVGGRVWLWPVEFSLLGYQTIFEYRAVWNAYANTVFYTVFGTAINVVLTIMAAYPLSRRDLQGRNLFMFMITFTMIFSGGLIPTYLLVRGLGMLNTRWVMMIPNAIAAWNIIITRTYYQSTIPDELHEAAQLDGCSDVRFLMSVVVPLSGAITAVNALFYAVAHWNAFFNAFIYLSKDELYPLQIILREVLIQNDFDNEAFTDVSDQETREGLRELLKFSLIIVASVPVLCIYPFVQKYFVRGVMIGSIKG